MDRSSCMILLKLRKCEARTLRQRQESLPYHFVEALASVALNYLDLVFEQSAIANNFCNMLRDWHDKARRGDRVRDMWKSCTG
ncbi:hypothetical protein PI95_026165 [Hassallia byssoidea VB512170]|uniref:Uncharacterized protein n=1 Tax=Hassallia byssoidea VB512170 TaxID=1304833 RepID=A0A846HEH0_9CYAN|nr:hypothetical protein [Hassalia byssoidea]NEU75947.1 hypothetical protein [Hassalia byssoidea VB512170]